MRDIVHWWGDLSLRGKLMASVLAPTLVIASLFYVYSIRGIHANFDREYRERALAISQALQQTITEQDLDNIPNLQRTLQGLVGTNPSIHHLSVYALRNGQPALLASSDLSLIGKVPGPHDLEPILTGQTVLFEEKKDEQVPLMEVNTPLLVGGTPIAAIGVYISLESRDALIRSQGMSLLIIGGGGIILMLALVFFSTDRLIVGPVTRISRAASRIAKGDLETKVPTLGQDEVGLLASSMKAMVGKLLDDRRTLEHQATTDGLTNLWNYRYFYERL
ncbi:MAG: HAMP domain-containing protein, partial [Dehalococcoidia bacterium]|nr:HAMP domain-containing protein [Dehalococcoidia bacterium]